MKVYKEIDLKWIKDLRSGAVCIHPTDTAWALSCSAFSKKGVLRLNDICKNDKFSPPTILIDSVARLKKYVYRLHPRIETLLSYHHRPLILLFSEIKMLPTHLLDDKGCAALCIVHDHRIKKLIKSLNQPLIYCSVKTNSTELQTKLYCIADEIKEKVNFVYHPSGALFNQTDTGRPPVIANVDENGNLLFV
jgi:L-threonylcarbamoyladenylate synthase